MIVGQKEQRMPEMGRDHAGLGARPFCIPTTATLVQEADAYLAWAGKHADMLTQPTYVTLQRALAEAFPCPK
jgi:hypothetical protein